VSTNTALGAGSAEPTREAAVPESAKAQRFRRHLEGVLGVPATEGNQLDVLRNGSEIFPAMLEAISGARHTVDFLTFVYWRGQIATEFGSRLCERAQHGTRVRVLLDSWGAHSMDKDLLEKMDRCGVEIRWFRPLARLHPGQVNHRTHRKVLIVDEAIGFTGGVGIADEWQGDARNEHEWRDTHLRVRGPAVDGLRAAFLDNWAETDTELFDDAVDRFPDQPKPGGSTVQCVRGTAETGLSDIATLFRTLLQIAETRVRVTTAYFVPDTELTARLCQAADRGVEVEILLPGPHADKRLVQLAGEATYRELLDHGVILWTFQPSMLHAKVMTVDGTIANVGSSNLNERSAQCDEEINLVILDDDVVRKLDQHFDEDLERSVRIVPGRWKRRPALQRVAEAVVRPLRRLF
jgi:cardiolipin synthase A/B